MKNWREVLKRERSGQYPAQPPVDLFRYRQGVYYRTHDGAETPEAIRRVEAFRHALLTIPVLLAEEQEFYGGVELFRRAELPPEIEAADYAEAIRYADRHPLRPLEIGSSHTVLDFETVLTEGLGRMIERARLAERHFQTPIAVAMRQALEALRDWLQHAADVLAASRPAAAERLRRIAVEPPRHFDEAIQLVWALFVALEMEGRAHNALGRIDQYLLPFWRHDQLDREPTLDFLCQLWSKIDGFQEVTNLCIGGVTPDGRDAANPLSFLMLEATGLVRSAHTNLSARLHDASSDAFLLACIRLIGSGIGFPAVFNDEVNIRMLQHFGIPLAAARDYALVGCVEVQLAGRQCAWGDSRFNLPKIFTETMLHLPEFPTFEALWEAFAAGVRCGLEEHARRYNAELAAFDPAIFPDPVLSAVTRDCLNRGCDINAGGSEFPRFHGIGMMGLATLANSLAAVKKLVYEEKRIEPVRLVEALRRDFQGDEELRQTLIHCAPKYGNDEPYCDELAARIVELCAAEAGRLTMADGGCFQSCMASNTSNIPAGAETMATADGRHAGVALSDAASPDAGLDREGPTAFVNSIIRPDYSQANCTVVNMRFLPEMFDDPGRLLVLLRRFISGRGHEMQFNVTDNATLAQAIAEPEKYADLIVRVSGFSAFFTQLDPLVQRDIMRRRAHGC